MTEPKGDKPRKIVVCHPDQYIDIQRAVAKLGYGDVLVKPNRYIEPGTAYVMDGEMLLHPLTLDYDFTLPQYDGCPPENGVTSVQNEGTP